jgi:hypothetical protein
MDIITSLFAMAATYVAVSSALVWGIVEVLKKTFGDKEKASRLAPWLALGSSLVVNVLVWLYVGTLTPQSFVPYAIASLLIFAGSDTVHDLAAKLSPKATESSLSNVTEENVQSDVSPE